MYSKHSSRYLNSHCYCTEATITPCLFYVPCQVLAILTIVSNFSLFSIKQNSCLELGIFIHKWMFISHNACFLLQTSCHPSVRVAEDGNSHHTEHILGNSIFYALYSCTLFTSATCPFLL